MNSTNCVLLRVHLFMVGSELAPSGCTVTTVGATCEVHLMLWGMVDTEKEISRLEKKIETLISRIGGLENAMSIEGYEEKVCIMVSTVVCDIHYNYRPYFLHTYYNCSLLEF